MDKIVRHLSKLGKPFTDKATLRIMILPLLDWIVDAQGIDPSEPALHLYLRDMDGRLVVDKLTGEPVFKETPIKPEVITQK